MSNEFYLDYANNIFRENNENNTTNINNKMIELDYYTILFTADYAGFLYIIADEFILQTHDEHKMYIIKQLNKFFLDAGDYVYIKNPINLKNIRFEKFDASKINKYQNIMANNEKIMQENLKKFQSFFYNLNNNLK